MPRLCQRQRALPVTRINVTLTAEGGNAVAARAKARRKAASSATQSVCVCVPNNTNKGSSAAARSGVYRDLVLSTDTWKVGRREGDTKGRMVGRGKAWWGWEAPRVPLSSSSSSSCLPPPCPSHSHLSPHTKSKKKKKRRCLKRGGGSREQSGRRWEGGRWEERRQVPHAAAGRWGREGRRKNKNQSPPTNTTMPNSRGMGEGRLIHPGVLGKKGHYRQGQGKGESGEGYRW